ncbi:MFS transporter [Amnibacterium kyonggiense]|uniref:MFS transporter n=1 Tax=Amnibacterium kyonggiense TaxID=595671 RepID=A0A4R7FEW9_9MICO|nr:MFS transporter [Amnibacterium kyonggiense]TDS75889.1 MFS transporter [Amnibacterium kyonggiense]
MTAATDQRAAGLDERAKRRAFAVSIAVAVLTILDLSKVNVGLPSIETALRTGPTELQIIVAGYALAFGLALVPGGRLGDVRSRKTMFLVGLGVFTLFSLVCALAPTSGILLIARFLQGVGAGLQMPQVLGLTQELYQGEARGRALGVYGAAVGLGTALGPTIGGALIALGGEQDGWRLIFWMNVPLGLILLVLAARWFPGRQAKTAGRSLDPVGVVLLGLTVVAFMLPFVLTTGQRGDSPLRWLALIAAAVFLLAFLRWERHYAATDRTPAVDIDLFRRSSYRNGLIVATGWFAAGPATFLLNTLLLQEGLGLAPVFAGMVTIPFALASAVTSYTAGRLVNRYGRALVVVGLIAAAVGFALSLAAAVLSPPALTPWLMAAALLVAGAGGGSVVSPNQTLTLSEVPVAEGGVAGSVAQVGQRVGTAVGVAGASAVFFSMLNADLGGSKLADYHLAVLGGSGLAIVVLLAALGFALADLRLRRKQAAS